jgi:hypothetical protein
MSTGAAAVRATAKGLVSALPSGLLFLNNYTSVVPTNGIANALGTRTISGTAPAMSVSCAGSGIATEHSGSTATLSGYANPGNNGTFTIVIVTANSSFTIVNPNGVPEVGPAGSRIDVLGLCSQATDLIGGRVFAQTNTPDKFAVNRSLVPGKTVLCTGLSTNMGRLMTLTDAALAGRLNGTAPYSQFIYLYPVLYNAQTSFTQWQTFEDATSVSWAASRVSGNNSQRSSTKDAAGVLTETILQPLVLPLNTWQLWTMTHSGAQAQCYVDGSLSVTVAATARARANLTRIVLSNRGDGSTGLVGTRHYRAIEGAADHVMSLSEVQSVLAYCRSVIV